MAGNKSELSRESAINLVSEIYRGALDPSGYNKIFELWDRHQSEVFSAEKLQIEEFDWAGEFVTHFEQAGAMLDRLESASPKSADQLVRECAAPSFVIARDGRLLAVNKACANSLDTDMIRTVFDFALDPDGISALQDWLTLEPEKTAQEPPLVLRIYDQTDSEPSVFVGGWVSAVSGSGEEDGQTEVVQFRTVQASWSTTIQNALRKAFELTDAELDLVKFLNRGLSIKEISERKGRSAATLRTQLSSVLHKTGAKSQIALTRIVSGLIHIIEARKGGEDDRSFLRSWNTQLQRSHIIETSNGLTVECIESGNLDGEPVYCIQTTTSPFWTGRIIQAFRKKGLRVISPVRPGCGHSTRTPVSFTTDDWAKIHVEVMDAMGLEQCHLAGHCSGGIYALSLAQHVPDRVKSVQLIDTGAPLARSSQIYAMPSAPRRLFLAARFFSRAIVTPIRYVAADFHSGPEGEARAVHYFYEGSPVDQAMLHAGDNWQATRNNIAYCFKNVGQLVRDITIWSRDTSHIFEKVVATTPLHFIHGRENLVHRAGSIEKFCKLHKNAHHHLFEGEAQLLCYNQGGTFVCTLAECVGSA